MRSVLAATLALGLCACQSGTVEGTAMIPAKPVAMDDTVAASLTAMMAETLGRPNVRLNIAALSDSGRFTILPNRPGAQVGNATARPEAYDLMVEGDACYAVHAQTGEAIALTGMTCEAIS